MQERLLQQQRLHGAACRRGLALPGARPAHSCVRVQKEGLTGKKAPMAMLLLRFRDSAAADEFVAKVAELKPKP